MLLQMAQFPSYYGKMISHCMYVYMVGWLVGLVSKSCLVPLATPWTVARQAPRSLGFSRQEYWSGLPFPSPGDLPDSGIKPGSPALQADSLPTELQGKLICVYIPHF